MRTHSRHRCGHLHSSCKALAQCFWGECSCKIEGNGQYARLSFCHPDITHIRLYDTEAEAMQAIDGLVCEHDCRGLHEIVKLQLTYRRAA